MDENTENLARKLQSNPMAIRALMNSGDGRQLLQLLTQGDGGASLQQAAQAAARGDASAVAGMIAQLAQSPQGAALMERISKTMQQ